MSEAPNSTVETNQGSVGENAGQQAGESVATGSS